MLIRIELMVYNYRIVLVCGGRWSWWNILTYAVAAIHNTYPVSAYVCTGVFIIYNRIYFVGS